MSSFNLLIIVHPGYFSAYRLPLQVGLAFPYGACCFNLSSDTFFLNSLVSLQEDLPYLNQDLEPLLGSHLEAPCAQ